MRPQRGLSTLKSFSQVVVRPQRVSQIIISFFIRQKRENKFEHQRVQKSKNPNV